MKKILITGATGMVGSQVLNALLENDSVVEIVSLGRSKTGITNKKLREIQHNDFSNFESIKDDLINLDACFHCLSVYRSQVNREEYKTITCDYQKALTDVLQKTSPKLTFVLHGAAGADTSEKSKIIFSKAKGKAENLLNATGFPKKYIFRPGHIQPTGKRKPPGIGYRITLPLISLFFKLIPSMGTTDKYLGKAMVEIGLQDQVPSRVFENRDIRNIIKN